MSTIDVIALTLVAYVAAAFACALIFEPREHRDDQ